MSTAHGMPTIVLDPVTRDQAGVIAGAAREDLHRVDVAQHRLRILAEQLRGEAAEVDHASIVSADRARLLVDFLLHEVPVRAEFQRRQRDIGDVHVALHLRGRPRRTRCTPMRA